MDVCCDACADGPLGGGVLEGHWHIGLWVHSTPRTVAGRLNWNCLAHEEQVECGKGTVASRAKATARGVSLGGGGSEPPPWSKDRKAQEQQPGAPHSQLVREDLGGGAPRIHPVMCEAGNFPRRGGGDALRDPILGGGEDALRDHKGNTHKHTHTHTPVREPEVRQSSLESLEATIGRTVSAHGVPAPNVGCSGDIGGCVGEGPSGGPGGFF